jgi:pimeloyl-ACP methyl ester carboxylesterase
MYVRVYFIVILLGALLCTLNLSLIYDQQLNNNIFTWFVESVRLCYPYIYKIYNQLSMINFWICLLLIWLVIDVYRYIGYFFAYRKLNIHPEQRDTNHGNIKKMLQDFEHYPDILEDLIHDIFFNKIRMEDMNFDEVCESVFEMIGENEQYRKDIKNIIKNFQLAKRKKGINIFMSRVHHNRVRHNKHDIISWFNILPIYLLTRGINICVILYMKCLGYQCYRFNSGLKIWYNKYDQEKGTPLIFFHASVGGVTFQAASLGHLHTKHNIIMPEIPGVSFIDTYECPPPISEIIENVHEFILNHYINNQSQYFVDGTNFKINLMGHSLGCTICSAYINKYPKHVDSFFCVEGQIFFPRALRISEDFASRIEDIPIEDLIIVPLFHRDLYVQYFMIKRLTLDSTMLFDMNDDDFKNIKIHMYHVKDDRKLLIRPQLEYATRKKIKLTYHLFEGNYCHGSFALNTKIRKYILDNIQKVYDDQDNSQFNILIKP